MNNGFKTYLHLFSFAPGSWHDQNPDKPGKVKPEVVTEPDEDNNHVDISTPTDDQLENDVNWNYE